MNPLDVFFSWPQGGVWSNLLASAIVGVPAFIWGHRHFKKIHKHNEESRLLLKRIQTKGEK